MTDSLPATLTRSEGLRRISRASGAFAMLAVDQRQVRSEASTRMSRIVEPPV